jgi:hypothetical protein
MGRCTAVVRDLHANDVGQRGGDAQLKDDAFEAIYPGRANAVEGDKVDGVGFDLIFKDAADAVWRDTRLPKPRTMTKLHTDAQSCNNVFTIIARGVISSTK